MHTQMNSFRSILLIIVCGLVSSCASTGGTAKFLPPGGSVVEIRQELTVNSGSRLFIQNGRAMKRAGVAVVTPYCYFSLDLIGDETRKPLTLKPDTFRVTKSYQRRDYVSSEFMQYAGRAGSDRTLSTIMELSSGIQQEVTRLVCSRWGMMGEVGWLTIAEMKSTLGGLVEIVLADN